MGIRTAGRIRKEAALACRRPARGHTVRNQAVNTALNAITKAMEATDEMTAMIAL